MVARTDLFLEMSSLLTGFSRLRLLGTGMTDEYLEALDEALPAGVLDELLTAYARLPPGADREAAVGSRLLGDEKLGPVARNVILLWYCASWSALPDDWRKAHGSVPGDRNRVVSPEAYVAGLQWTAAGAHPAGARPPGFGAWAAAPERASR